MNVGDFFDTLKAEGFTLDEIFSLIAYTEVDVERINKATLKKLVPGFRILIKKMKEHSDFIDDLLGFEPEPES